MRPYFAIIKDSFRAAWASKVLYVLLGLITVLLLSVAPLHYRESLDWKLIPSDYIQQFDAISQRLFDRKEPAEGAAEVTAEASLLAKIWNEIPQGLREDLVAFDGSEESGAQQKRAQQKRANPTKRSLEVFNELIGELNNIIAQPDFFSSNDLSRLALNEEAQSIGDVANPSSQNQRRRNRIVIAKLFHPFIPPGDTTSMAAYYGPWRLSFLDSFAASKSQFASGIAAYIPGILDKFVLSIGLAVAIVVTASIIPETFEPGSLNLLLSKPISRWGLFVAKFLGGCVFISICATYLFAGVWLWLGLALGVWESAILLSIVLYVIVFGIYFSVSAFVGLVYRSTILAIMVTLLFWGACFLVGTSYGFLDTRLQNTRIVKLAQSDQRIVALDRMSQLTYWDPRGSQWVSPYPPDQQDDQRGFTAASWFGDLEEFPLPFGPLVNPGDRRLVAGRTSMSNMLSFGQQELLASSPGGGPLVNQGNFPRGTVDFLQGSKALIAVSGEGKFFRFGNEANTQATSANEKSNGKRFVPLGPDRPSPVTRRGLCAINRSTGEIAVFGNRVLSVFRRDDVGYRFDRSIEIETGAPESMSGLLAFQGNALLLALGNGQIITLDATTLEELFGYRPEVHHAVEEVGASDDGRWFFVLYRNGKVWALDTQSPQEMALAKFSGQGSISAICVTSAEEVLVADRGSQVTRYDLKNFQPLQTVRPQDGTVEQLYYWLIQPLYNVWPKPGEFYKVVAWIAEGDDEAEPNEIDLRLKPKYRNPWAPLTSGLTFMTVMIGLSCLYFWRKDY